jgi:RHS repeat-associated protein
MSCRLRLLCLFPLFLAVSTLAAASLQEPGCRPSGDALLTAPCAGGEYGTQYRESDLEFVQREMERSDAFTAVPRAFNDLESDRRDPGSLFDPVRHDDYCGAPVSTPSGVYLFSGEFYHRAVDMRIPGRGLDFVWARKYRSRLGPNDGLGAGWDFAYNIKLFLVDDAPSEARDLGFQPNKQDLTWSPPADPGGPPSMLRYCVLRSTDPTDFDDLATTTFIEIEDVDLVAQDTDEPGSGELYAYLILPKNGTHAGPLGDRSDGTPREGLTCGLTGPDLLLADGTGRRDAYLLQPGDLWAAPEFFRVIEENPDGSFSMIFPDTGTWNFHGFGGGSPEEGKIRSIVDRNGNSLDFTYDPGGRLIAVSDTLGRDILIGHNADGFIETVTDHTGREVRYEYYSIGDPGGSFGDLKSSTSPAVVGTVTGNDYPSGKTTVYTYSKGLAEERLNHNLLTITDPKGHVYLINEYAPTTDPTDPDFDHVLTQIWGDPGDRLDYVYLPVSPDPSNGFSVVRTIVNDREGNVREHFYDESNRGVLIREYTGRAPDPDAPTTDVLNRPVGPLRLDDPPYFETHIEYTLEARLNRVVFPNLNEELYFYDELNPDRRSQGNLTEHCRLPGPLGGDQPQVCETYEYDDLFGGGGGTNFTTRHVDGRGNETLHVYDAHGNRTHTTHRVPASVEDWEYNGWGQATAHVWPDNGSGHRRRDELTYHTAGPQTGYLHQEIADATGLALTTEYEYNARGHVTRIVDPRGGDTLYGRNDLDQVVRSTSREVLTSGGPVRYERDIYYDANDDVVRVDVQSIDEQGVLQPNTHYTTLYEYDPLNRLIRDCAESGSYTGPIPGTVNLPVCTGLPQSEFVVTEYEYDANCNRTLTRLGEATDGDQPANVRQYLYDERDLLFRVVRAPGHADQSTTQYDYDGNRNLRAVRAGLEAGPHVMLPVHDGYDRMVLVADVMGNEREHTYDQNDHRLSSLVRGELVDVPGGVGNVRLYESTYEYDPLNRLIGIRVEFFDPATQLAIDDGHSDHSIGYTDHSQISARTDDNGNTTSYAYDSANRLRTVTDAKANELTYDYDANSNVVTLTETEKSDLGSPDEIYYTNYTYDGLDRRIRTDNNISSRQTYEYDSRDNVTVYQDALRTGPTDPGNVTRYEYDGLNRLVQTTRVLTDTGDGSGTPVGTIATQESWDDSSRLTGQTDGAGNLTQYEYDPLNRLVQVRHHDGTLHTATYDAHDSLITRTDANGSISTYSYDPLNRLIGKTIARGPGVQGTTSEGYEYDGLNRLVLAQDDDALVTREHDSLSNLTGETINGKSTGYSYDGVGNKIEMTYPGGRGMDYTYDSLNRVRTITDGGGGLVADYQYVGHRVVQRGAGNGTVTGYEYDGIVNPPGDFGVKRIIRTTHTGPGGLVDDHVYAWDRMQNKTLREDVRPTGPQLTHTYGYDSIYRLVRSEVSDPLGPIYTQVVELDPVGNRVVVTGGADPGPYVLDPTMPVPADWQVNQYSATPFDARRYDDNGNLVQIDPTLPTQRDIAYDYLNQMVEHFDVSTGKRHNYSYDPLGRRIGKIRTAPTPDETFYSYDGHRMIEEQDALGATLATYVHGSYIDELVQMQRGPGDYYYHTDALYNVTAMTDAMGMAVERYEYEDYGRPTFFDGAGTPLGGSAIGNPYLFTGRRYDEETAWYYYRTRYLDPRAGRFTTRDTIGFWGDPLNLGNACSYVGNNPATWTDPLGRSGKKGTLIVASKTKEQVKSAGMKADGSVVDAVDGEVHRLIEEAARKAKSKTKGTSQSSDVVVTDLDENTPTLPESTDKDRVPSEKKAQPPPSTDREGQKGIFAYDHAPPEVRIELPGDQDLKPLTPEMGTRIPLFSSPGIPVRSKVSVKLSRNLPERPIEPTEREVENR